PLGDPADIAGRRLDRAVVRRAWRLAAPYHRKLAGFVGLIVVAASLGAVPPLLVRAVIDDAIPSGDTRTLTLLFLGMLAVALGMAAISLVERVLSASIGENFILDLRTMLFSHVQSMPIAFFTRTQTGALITRLNNDVVGAQRALTGTLGGVVDNLISVTVTLVAMFALEWRVTLLAVALLPLFVIPARIVGRRLQLLARESMQLNADMNSTMTERFNVSGALLVKLFGRSESETELFHDRAERVAEIGVRTAIHGRVLFAALGLIGSLATALVYLVGGRLVISPAHAIEAGTVVALAMYVTQLYGPLAQLSNARVDLMTALVSFERVFEVVDLPRAIDEARDAVPLPDPVRGHLRFEDVWFRYPAAEGTSLASLEGPRSEHGEDASEWILEGIDLDAPPGTMVALVGPSGAGKTTLSMLVPRVHDVTGGHVRIDGHDVRDVTMASLADAVGVVTQDPHLFHDSIAANLRYARPDATDAELVAACRAARIAHVIERLPDGYDTVVGERGYRLSGGEKQRLAIARVILKDPAIVILDEATAHLDSDSERLVQAALRDILRERTSLVIAHRLSTIVDADVILVVDGGRVVERGTHAELFARDGLYAELARTQLTGADA
ncbi:MAG: ABC transporter ATP-binding protein/permease, partial [Actinobacteria bacterium]|nr:ABC transporter ATP-binding protein/permease [Actinomycetota bacterium]